MARMRRNDPEALVRKIPIDTGDPAGFERFLTREWLVTNGLGGYASGTVGCVTTRRFHGMLIAALPNPMGRTMMFNHLGERFVLPDGTEATLGAPDRASQAASADGVRALSGFRLEGGLPIWEYTVGAVKLERRVHLVHGQNTVHISYRLLEGKGPVRLELRPMLHFRPHEAKVDEETGEAYNVAHVEGVYEVSDPKKVYPPLRFLVHGEGGALTVDAQVMSKVLYRVEEHRGYEYEGALWSPGFFTVELNGEDATLTASTEEPAIMRALSPEQALRYEYERRRRLLGVAQHSVQHGFAGELVLAADQFVIAPAGRSVEAARARAAGDVVRTVIAGYHWFTDWGRDTMISLEGLTLTTGRYAEAGSILRTFARYIRDGLIPNMFPEGEQAGLYHTADATLWFFHALHRYSQYTRDRDTLQMLLPHMETIIERHLAGTNFNIHVDPADGLLTQGAEGYQLTWMDAKVGDWVVTPRRGKAVEINALWYNALRLTEGWVRELRGDDKAVRFRELAAGVRESFNRRFWYEKGRYLYDVIDGPDGDDAACRPNQIFSISLDHPVLEESCWSDVMGIVQNELLTPVGLRSLSREHPDYKKKYWGDLRARDAAYHQGTVWGWLIGPFIDAWLKVHPDDRRGARQFLEAFPSRMSDFGVGTIAEVFDAEAPFDGRGCIAQAWSVAEVLRCWNRTAEEPERQG